jgi:pyruvate dehydrogenase E2 component (dihydrolipoamide acetyltransferase)
MRVDVIMPQMGESIQEGTLTRWMKKIGEAVKRDEPLFEISTDKVDAEIPSPVAGRLAEVRTTEGTTVPINTIVAVIETEASVAIGGDAPAASSPAPAAAPAAASGAAAAAPAAASQQAPASGTRPATSPAAAASPAAVPAPIPFKPRSEMTPEELRRTRSSPVVRKIAAEHGVDFTSIPGTGVSGRVTRADILAAIESGSARPAAAGGAGRSGGVAASAAPAAMPHIPAFAAGERFVREPMTVMRRKIAEHMIASRRTSAHVTTVFEIDFNRIDGIRKEKGAAFLDRHGAKLTYMPFLAAAVVESLKAFPILNSSIDGDDILYKKDINLGIAVALEWGLIVPVVKNAQDLSLAGIAKAIGSVAERARTKKLAPDDVQGGTFTITNPGIYGGLFGTPIISQPQVAILGVGTVEKRPVVVGDAIAIHPMCYLALSFDHRIIDGAVADQFMADLKRRLQEFDGSTV